MINIAGEFGPKATGMPDFEIQDTFTKMARMHEPKGLDLGIDNQADIGMDSTLG